MMNMMPPVAMPMTLWAQMARVSFESQLVIGIRMAGMMGLMAQRPDEPLRMITEKHEAAMESVHAVLHATLRGDSAEKMMSAALLPYARRTRANSRRLGRKRG